MRLLLVVLAIFLISTQAFKIRQDAAAETQTALDSANSVVGDNVQTAQDLVGLVTDFITSLSTQFGQIVSSMTGSGAAGAAAAARLQQSNGMNTLVSDFQTILGDLTSGTDDALATIQATADAAVDGTEQAVNQASSTLTNVVSGAGAAAPAARLQQDNGAATLQADAATITGDLASAVNDALTGVRAAGDATIDQTEQIFNSVAGAMTNMGGAAAASRR